MDDTSCISYIKLYVYTMYICEKVAHFTRASKFSYRKNLINLIKFKTLKCKLMLSAIENAVMFELASITR